MIAITSALKALLVKVTYPDGVLAIAIPCGLPNVPNKVVINKVGVQGETVVCGGLRNARICLNAACG